jgi:hypothetical protein
MARRALEQDPEVEALGAPKLNDDLEDVAGLRIAVRPEHRIRLFAEMSVTWLRPSNPIVGLM